MKDIYNDRFSGMSLVEVLFSMVFLGIFATTVLTTVLMGQRLAEANVYENTALTVTMGYLEQIKSMEYDQILDSLADNTVAIPTKSVSSILIGQSIEIDDPIYFGQVNQKEVLIDLRDIGSGNPRPITFDYELTISANDLDTGTSPIKALEIIFDYRYLSPERGSPQWKTDSVRFVKSFIPTF